METGNNEGRRLTVHQDGVPCYDIVYRSSFADLGRELTALGYAGRQFCIVTDDHVGPLYAEQVCKALAEICPEVPVCTIKAGRDRKDTDFVETIIRFLAEEQIDRNGLLIALGGTRVADAAGSAASGFQGGTGYIRIPTSLTAQTDLSFGDRAGGDAGAGKNTSLPACMPLLVYINVSVLETLDDSRYCSGFAGIMQIGLIRDEAFYVWLLENMYEILSREAETMQVMLRRSNEIRNEILNRGAGEEEGRMLLRLGHTIGRAVGKYSGSRLTRGECLALGCVAAAYISWKKEMISMDEYYEIRDMFVPFNLPISVEDIDPEEILKITRSDKKMAGDKIRFILLNRIGSAIIDETVTDTDITDAVNAILWKEED